MSWWHAPDPSLIVALALAAGIFAQAVARHLRLPGIVVLLGCGFVAGPDLLNIIHPNQLGPALHTLVGFAVAVILFEGGLNLNIRRLKQQGRSIQRLVTWGAFITMGGATLLAIICLGWPWRIAMLFGSLVIVTGPTVINPLLRRIRAKARVSTVLEAEGIFIDAVGAIVAVVALEFVVSPAESSAAIAAWDIISRLGFGFIFGILGGGVIVAHFHWDRLIPEGLQNVFTLSLALALYQLSNHFMPESGIMSVVIAGLMVGNMRTKLVEDLRDFKEQLTQMLIGMLFILLAADVRIADIYALGWPGIWTVIGLSIIVRPLNVFLCTWHTDLNFREQLFLSWVAPRGIIAAAMASLFTTSLFEHGFPEAASLQAMVFLVIGSTVLVQGLTSGFVARQLKMTRPKDTGWAILGANQLGRAFARLLVSYGEEVVFLETNPDLCREAYEEGFRALHGSGLDTNLLHRADLDDRAGCIAITSNDAVNVLFAQKAHDTYKVNRTWVALRSGHLSVTPEMIEEAHTHILFRKARNLDLWTLRFERKQAAVEPWVKVQANESDHTAQAAESEISLLPLMFVRQDKLRFVDENTVFQLEDLLHVVVSLDHKAAAHDWLTTHGWAPQPTETSST